MVIKMPVISCMTALIVRCLSCLNVLSKKYVCQHIENSIYLLHVIIAVKTENGHFRKSKLPLIPLHLLYIRFQEHA